ncbi:hypothetical protein CJ030_MR8G025478 [Morella rubra]|uniref:Uncharacterized protein n=1 Tax=Morella rubra TaxID=262757 RepID=A0A6A1UTQ9_9ROSI|nr:hypothetical protein CJ030_MR8G025478 [Morella rubra]
MLRTRVLWFGAGLSVAGAAISQFIWRDLSIDRHCVFSDVKQNLDALEARVLNVEAMSYLKPNSDQVIIPKD